MPLLQLYTFVGLQYGEAFQAVGDICLEFQVSEAVLLSILSFEGFAARGDAFHCRGQHLPGVPGA